VQPSVDAGPELLALYTELAGMPAEAAMPFKKSDDTAFDTGETKHAAQ
jgi:hypothetical protein